MKSLLDQQAYEEVLNRLDQLDENSQGQWGKMDVGQMAWHCKYPLQLAIKNKAGKVTKNPIFRWFFKKSLYNDKPWRKNLPTAPQLRATSPKDFKQEMGELKELVHQFYNCKDREIWNPHPIFGSFTKQQWGQMEYKHLDHHLKQFGA